MFNLTKIYIYILFITLPASFCRLTIVSPSQLINDFSDEPNGKSNTSYQYIIINLGIPYGIANYGVISYGKTLIGIAHYANPSNSCDVLTNEQYNDTNHTVYQEVDIVLKIPMVQGH